MKKAMGAFRNISEVAGMLQVSQSTLRYWESQISQIRPAQRSGRRRYYTPEDVLLLGGLKQLLHGNNVTIKGVQKILREQGVGHVRSLAADSLQAISKPAESPTAETSAGGPKTDQTGRKRLRTDGTTGPVEEATDPSPLKPLRLRPIDSYSESERDKIRQLYWELRAIRDRLASSGDLDLAKKATD
ncbi:MAG: MerR family transcriptional regulator [Paracoccaceae bacterium]|nr:MerR family transcriptional regulator [Paracoccaceae bacterium]